MLYTIKNFKQDYKKALEIFSELAKLGNVSAINSLGYMYEKGYGVKQDYANAMKPFLYT
jgi:TPR repeat protein